MAEKYENLSAFFGAEVHPAVEAQNVQARHEAKAEKKLLREKADRALRVRLIIAASAVVAFCLFGGAGLMAWGLALPLIALAGTWVAIWFGAWLQFRFAGGGLLDVTK